MRQGDLLAARFRIVGHLARSRRGEVWLARDEARDAPCEVESLRPSGTEGEEAVRLLQREVDVGRRLEGTPFVLRALAWGATDDGQAWIAREAAPGARPLAFREGDLLDRVARVARAARAVAALHAAGAVHRALGPAALLSGPDGVVRVADLGLVRLDGLAEPEGAFVPPSLACAAPELLDRPERATPRADVHALGALLFHALCGAWPWGERALDVIRAQERARAGSAEAPRPRRVASDVPAALDAICGEALELEPGERAASAVALAEVLEAWLEEAVPLLPPPPASPPALIPPPPALPPPAPPSTPRPDPLFVPEDQRRPAAAFEELTALEGGALVCALPAKGLERTVVALRHLDARGAPCLLVDLRRVQHLGGPQLEALTELLTLSERRGLPAALFGVSKPLRQLLRLMELEPLVPPVLDADDPRAALELMRARAATPS